VDIQISSSEIVRKRRRKQAVVIAGAAVLGVGLYAVTQIGAATPSVETGSGSTR
jgi:hypothetical protein